MEKHEHLQESMKTHMNNYERYRKASTTACGSIANIENSLKKYKTCWEVMKHMRSMKQVQQSSEQYGEV